ncbi:MAG: hypothetical protein ACYDAM_08920 [Leptospirales bacterium]
MLDPEPRTTAGIARNTLQELARAGKPPTPLSDAQTDARYADLPIDALLATLLELPEIFARIEEDLWTLKQLDLLKNFLPQADCSSSRFGDPDTVFLHSGGNTRKKPELCPGCRPPTQRV